MLKTVDEILLLLLVVAVEFNASDGWWKELKIGTLQQLIATLNDILARFLPLAVSLKSLITLLSLVLLSLLLSFVFSYWYHK